MYSCFLFAAISCGSLTQTSRVFAQTTQTQSNGFISHTVTAGETVYSLSKKYNVLMQDIYELNPDAKSGIKGGEVLQIPVKKNGDSKSSDRNGFGSPYLEYKVSKGETIFSIARQNEVSEETLMSLNPELKKGLKKGMILKIPRKQVQPIRENKIDPSITITNPKTTSSGSSREHVVAKGETIYGISKLYGVGIDLLYAKNPSLSEGLKTGMTIFIPQNMEPRPVSPINPIAKAVRVGILFPFLDNKATVQKEKLVEFYEGFLLAVQDMKSSGVNIEVYTFDSGLEKDIKRLVSILGTSEMANLDVLIGGTSQEQIDILTDFSNQTGVRYVIPFGGLKQNTIQGKRRVYQYVSSLSSLFNPIAKTFAQKFRGNNIIFVEEMGSDNNKKGFVSELKKELTSNGIAYKELRESVSLNDELKAVVSSSTNNIIIPTSASSASLQRIVKAMDNSEDGVRFSLFGYPEWQTYHNLYNTLHKYDATIYSTFYLNEGEQKVQSVMSQYRKWYNKSVAWSFPRYAFLGYDMGVFFISGINKEGADFDARVSSLRVPTLQSAMYFNRPKSDSGYVNTGFYFVRFKTNSSVEKTEYK